MALNKAIRSFSKISQLDLSYGGSKRITSLLLKAFTFNRENRFSTSSLLQHEVFSNKRTPYRCRKVYQGPARAVIFDWAGTVVDSGVNAPLFTFVDIFRNEGIDITNDEARGPMGAHKRVHIEKILDLENVRQQWINKKGTAPTKEDIDRMYSRFVPTIMSCIHKHSDVIRGVPETIGKLRNKYSLKIGSTTGFPKDILDVLVTSSLSKGYNPEVNIAADQVPMARSCPYMVWACAMQLGVQPIEAIIKVDDTVDGIGEGISAGCWTVGVAKTSNYVGLTEQELDALPKEELERKLSRSYEILVNSGAHYVIDTITDMPQVVDDINRRLASGEKP